MENHVVDHFVLKRPLPVATQTTASMPTMPNHRVLLCVEQAQNLIQTQLHPMSSRHFPAVGAVWGQGESGAPKAASSPQLTSIASTPHHPRSLFGRQGWCISVHPPKAK